MDLKQTANKVYMFLAEKVPDFINKHFEITHTRKSKIAGCAVCLLSLFLVIFCIDTYLKIDIGVRWILMALDLFLPFILGLSIIYTVRLKNKRTNKIAGFIIFLLMPIATMTMTECLNNVFVYDMTYLGFLGNYLVIIIFYFIIYALSGSFKLAYLILNPIVFGLGVAHSYLMDFRGTPFQPMDFLSVTTAANVANTYNFTPNYKIITALFLFILIMTVAFKMRTPEYHLTIKIIARSFTLTFASVILILFYGTSVFANMGVRPDFWNQTRGYHNYGFVFNFFANTKYLYMNEPNNYDPNQIKDYIDQTVNNDNSATGDTKKPNIICIMNESLSDLKVLGEFETNKDYMPFMRRLKENTVKGNLYVPVIGAGTSNTEFEFLTGHTTAFLPSGSNAYMLYIDNPMASLVSTLEAQRYSSQALHPYYSSGWNRPKVYSNFGFNAFTALENIMDISLMAEYQNNGSDPDFLQQLIDEHYPNSNMIMRQYVSDSYNYDIIIKDYKNRDRRKPYFIFNVTMQNHGGYVTDASNFDESIKITSSETVYDKANEYLSLVKASDKAFKGLIEFFSTVEEPTVICMFGDHQPNIETEFIAQTLGVKNLSNLTVEQEQARHITPFYIWANYDIKEEKIDKLSANYLSSLVLKTAGVELTEYNKYLLKLSETLPVINTVGYIDKDNNYYKWSDVSPYADLISEYEKIQYNAIFDSENSDNEIFFLKGYKHESSNLTGEEE